MFKHKLTYFILIATLFLMLAACSNDSNVQDDQQPDPTPIVDIVDGEQEQTDSETPTDEEDEEDIAPDEGEIEDEETIEIVYYMNSNYDIKPIDEGTEERVVLLTFDDGPKDEDMVNTMLDVLDKHDAKAIFFVNGHRVVQNPELLVEIHERGQIIGNHSWQHLNLTEQTDEKIDEEIEEVQRIVEETIGEKPLFFRPPYGAANDYVREKVAEEGMLYMNWSNGSLDWDAEYRTTEAILGSILEQLRPGSNILMHELEWTVEALDTILTTLTEEGYTFVDPRAIHLVPGNPKVEDLPLTQ